MARSHLALNPTIDQEFRALVHELSVEEYTRLKENLRSNGCVKPILTWEGCVIDGHHRIEICQQLSLPFETLELRFANRDNVVMWICRNELKKPGLSEPRWKYLIGKILLILKERYRKDKADGVIDEQTNSMFALDEKISQDYRIGRSTVQKYNRYAVALDKIGSTKRELFKKILDGDVSISYDSLILMSSASESSRELIAARIIQDNIQTVRENFVQSHFHDGDPPEELLISNQRSVKDNPIYDPDISVSGLIFTIPTWCYSLERIRDNKDYPRYLSDNAKSRFRKVLIDLHDIVENYLEEL